MHENEQLISDFLKDYDDEFSHGDLYLGAESYAIGDVADMLQNPEYDLPKSVTKILQDIWDDRVDGRTLLGVDERTQNDVKKLHTMFDKKEI